MNNKKNNTFSLLTPDKFLEDITIEASKAKKRIWLQAMFLEPGDVANKLVKIYKNNHAEKKLHIDYFGLLTSEGKFDYLKKFKLFLKKEEDKKELLFVKLRKTGVKVFFTNPPTFLEKIMPYHGRNHMKMTIIDDIAYVGGVNFSDKAFLNIDFMVKIIDRNVVSKIADLFLSIENEKLKDKKIIINKEVSLLVDSGETAKSIILDEAVALVKKAKKSVYHINQFVPDGKFLKVLSMVSRKGISVKVVVPRNNDFSRIFWLINKINRVIVKIKNQNIPLLYRPLMIHAKLTIIDEKIVIFGSHNLSEKGVTMKTGELAIQSNNKKLVHDLISYWRNIISKEGQE